MIATAKAVARAVAVYGTPAMKEMVKNCMDQDFSWKVRFILLSFLLGLR